jgi:hypothetical protein
MIVTPTVKNQSHTQGMMLRFCNNSVFSVQINVSPATCKMLKIILVSGTFA